MCLALLVKEQIRGIGGFPSTSNGDILYRMSLLATNTHSFFRVHFFVNLVDIIRLTSDLEGFKTNDE